MTRHEHGWNDVLTILGTLLLGWLGYFVVGFIAMAAIVWFFVNVWP